MQSLEPKQKNYFLLSLFDEYKQCGNEEIREDFLP
tara:strand:- start:699 stop:803 length:105 start_codon:yes stop_codon:yes gene_type:complete